MNPVNKALNDLDRAATHLRAAADASMSGTVSAEIVIAAAEKVEQAAETLAGIIKDARAALHAL